MITTLQGEIIVELVRKHGKMLRGESFKTLRHINALVRAREANVPENFLLPFSAALSGLYEDPGAFPGSHWAALLRDGTYASDRSRRMLGLPADDWSEKIRFGNASWRKPKPALLITLLAAYVGVLSA